MELGDFTDDMPTFVKLKPFIKTISEPQTETKSDTFL